MSARVSQEGALAITTGTPQDRVSQVGTLAITTGTPLDRISQAGVLVIYSTDPSLAAAPQGLRLGRSKGIRIS